MTQNEWRDVLPEELAAVDELARLLEQYQTHLLAGSGFADSVRAQAGNASGTARPALERLLPEGVARIESALRRPRTKDDRKIVLEEVGPALKDLRALLAISKWRKPITARDMAAHADPLAAVSASDVSQAHKPALADNVPHSNKVAPTVPRSRAWIWVGSGLAVGLILGAFGTELPRSAGLFARLWMMLQPVIATGSGVILGSLLLQGGWTEFRDTIRKRWVTLLVSSVLLISTAPNAVDAARELFGTLGDTPAPVLQEVENPSPQLSPPASLTNNPSPEPTQNASSQPGTDSRGATANPADREIGRPSATVAADCAKLVERQSLGEEITQGERAFLTTRCRN